MVWTPVPQGVRAFELTAELGTSLELPNRKRVAVSIVPTAYLPRAMACPALVDQRCGIQDDKPLRCRAMPFYAYRREEDQGDMLIPRKGWACDISDQAPLVYRDRRILDRDGFDAERAALMAQAPRIRSYAENALKLYPVLLGRLQTAMRNPAGGNLVVSFASFVRWSPPDERIDFARRQYPVLVAFTERTAKEPGLATYHDYYREAAAELEWLARQA
ncbi:hypothetical protein [Thiocystis violacea]|uniref:hypothetical protein n=1 Tax=Thiocystis violacea TaxID=13725 RepID=UPI00190862AD|nr:hypothetical protein [Thiocystis violacea]